jgi:hypothetical protein
MTCKDIEDRLAAYQEGAITPEEKTLVEAHLSTCAKCSSVLADLKKTDDLLKDLPEVELPPWFTQKVMAQVREETEHKDSLLKKLFYPFHVKIPIEVFATLFVVVLGLYVYKTTGSEMKVVQRPPPALVEITPKDEALKYGEDKAKIDTEGFHQKEPASQPPASGKRKKIAAETMLEKKQETPAVSTPALPAPARSLTKERDTPVPAGAALRDEREKKLFQAAPRPEKIDVQKPTFIALILSVEDVAKASIDVEKVLSESGALITKGEFREDAQTLVAYFPARKLEQLIGRLRNIGDVKDYRSMTEATEASIQVTIQIIPK